MEIELKPWIIASSEEEPIVGSTGKAAGKSKKLGPWLGCCCESCWFAREVECTCKCGGVNHGRGVTGKYGKLGDFIDQRTESKQEPVDSRMTGIVSWKPRKTRIGELECVLTSEAGIVPEEIKKRANGCASKSMHHAWVFIDGVVSHGNVCFEDIIEPCWHCVHYKNSRCVLGISPFSNVFIGEICRTTLHELLHLCDCTEEQIGIIDSEMHPFWHCPQQHDKKENLDEPRLYSADLRGF